MQKRNTMKVKHEVAKRAGITLRYLNRLLYGDRAARPEVAKTLQRVTHIHRSIWVFGTSKQRQQLFKDFLETDGQRMVRK